MLRYANVSYCADFNHQSHQYTYKCYDDDIEVGDYVIVYARNGLAVAQIEDFFDFLPCGTPFNLEIKDIVGAVDVEKYNNLKAKFDISPSVLTIKKLLEQLSPEEVRQLSSIFTASDISAFAKSIKTGGNSDEVSGNRKSR